MYNNNKNLMKEVSKKKCLDFTATIHLVQNKRNVCLCSKVTDPNRLLQI